MTDIVYEDPALLDDDSDDEDDDDEAQKDPLLALETIVVSIIVRRVGKSRRLRAVASLRGADGHGPHAVTTRPTTGYALGRHELEEVPGRGRGRVRRGRAATRDEAPVARLPRRPLPEFSGKTRRAVALRRAAPRDDTTAGRDALI